MCAVSKGSRMGEDHAVGTSKASGLVSSFVLGSIPVRRIGNFCFRVYLCHLFQSWLFLEWILKNKIAHLIMFKQCSILNPHSPDIGENRTSFVRRRTETLKNAFKENSSKQSFGKIS